MSQAILKQINELKNVKLTGLSEKTAPAAIATELGRLKRSQLCMDLLLKMNSEFAERQQVITSNAEKLKIAILKEKQETEARRRKIDILNQRGDELRVKAERLKEELKLRAQNFHVGQFQREEIWQLILRMADLVSGLREKGVLGGAQGPKRDDSDVLEVLVRTNADRIVDLETQLEYIQVEMEDMQRNKGI